MTIEVSLPDGSVAEFPDGTSKDVMKSAMQKHVQKSTQAQRDAIMAPPPAPPKIPMQGEEFSPAGEKTLLANGMRGRGTDFSTDARNALEGYGRVQDKVLDGITGLYLDARGETAASKGNDANVSEKRRLDKPLAATAGGQFGEGMADAALVAAPGGGVVRAARVLPRGIQTAAKLIGAGAVNSELEGVKAPDVARGEDRGTNAAFGFGSGVVGEGLGSAAGRIIRGVVPVSPQAERLPKQVFDASTLGQVADRRTTAGRMASGTEEKFQSLPLTGDIIRNARGRGVDAWRNDVVRQVTPPGRVLPQVGRENPDMNMRQVMDEAQNQFGEGYKTALKGQTVVPSSPFEQRVLKVTSDPGQGLMPAQQSEIRDLTMNYYNNMFKGVPGANGAAVPQATGESAKQFESFLRAQARRYRQSQSPQGGAMADTFDHLAEAWTPAYRSQLPLATRAQLKPLDQAYAPFKTVERASTYLGNEEGAFTPSQLLNSVKARSNISKFARGDGLMQDAADTGKVVYGDKVPNSGTIDRGATTASGIALMIDPLSTMGTLAAASTPAGLMVTRPGKNFMTGRTRAQMLLKKMRADQALDQGGAAIGEGLEDYMEQ